MNYSNSDCRIRRIPPAAATVAPGPGTPRPPAITRTRKSISPLAASRHALAALALTASASALDITAFSAPDAWLRGSANTTYYGWDVFEGGPKLLNDSTPDASLNPYGIAGVSMVQNNADFANVRSSTNLYAGQVGLFDITTTVKTDGVPASGFTTILVQVAGSVFGPTQTAAQFDDGSFLINGQLPDYITDGYIADNRNLWWLEWNFAGNQATYALEIDTHELLTSGSLSKITIDTAWSPSASLNNANVNVVPEPTAAALLAGAGLLALVRRRRSLR